MQEQIRDLFETRIRRQIFYRIARKDQLARLPINVA
jgi:hypothetical protein